jgi:hypothetical protein
MLSFPRTELAPSPRAYAWNGASRLKFINDRGRGWPTWVVILTDLKICGGLSWIANTDWSNLKCVVVWQMTTWNNNHFLQLYCIFARFRKFQNLFESRKPSKNRLKERSKVADVNEGKFVFSIVCFITALKLIRSVAYGKEKIISHYFSAFLFILPFFVY